MQETPFDPAASDAQLKRIAEADALTVVVGAGASAETGLPDWSQLVYELLREVAGERGLKGDDTQAFIEWVVKRDSLTGAGAVAKAALGERFMPTLRRALYGAGSTTLLFPGNTALGTGRLRLSFSDTDSEVVTTNYDPLLEEGLELELEDWRTIDPETFDHLEVVARTDDSEQLAHELVVRHVHGLLLPRGRSSGQVVLSEADYHLMQDPESWQEEYFATRLESSLCLFVATSLTDPNLLRYIYRTGGSSGHVACFARQQDADLYREVGPAVALARESTAEERWEAAGVHPMRVDHFSHSAQVLFEIARMRRLGNDYVPYFDRLIQWESDIRRSVLSTGAKAFPQRQDELQEILLGTVDAVGELLSENGFEPRRGERLGCSLWVHRPSSRTLVNWASSDRVWRDPRTLEPVTIDWASPFVSVQAFCSGSIVSYSTEDQPATRFNHVVGLPLFLDEWDDLVALVSHGSDASEYGRLPVGVLTVASTAPATRSVLSRGLKTLRTVILPQAMNSLAWLLRPEQGP